MLLVLSLFHPAFFSHTRHTCDTDSSNKDRVLLLVLCRYVTNQAAAEELEVGRGLGCSYATGQCEKFLKEDPKNNNFCPSSWNDGERCLW